VKTGLRFGLIIGGIIAILAAYTGYWFYAADRVDEEIHAWIADKENSGYQIEYSDLQVGGFPYRFQINIADPRIRAPLSDGGWFAHLDAVQANALPYDFSHWIVSFAGPLVIEGEETVRINATTARFSRKSNSEGETVRIGAEVSELSIRAITGTEPQITDIETLLLSGQVGDDNSLRIRVEATGLHASSSEVAENVRVAFGDTGELARMAFQVTEWRALALEGDAGVWSRAGGVVRVEDAELSWGPAHLTGEGDVTLDTQARLDGRLSVRITDPDALADALVEGGLVPEENEQALRLATMLAPRSEEGVSLPFRIREGGIYLGPVRLGSVE